MDRKLAQLDYSVLQQCIHCGLCLPTCPTYRTTNNERNSPRGRISLMRAVADGRYEMGPALADEMDYCLGCLACETACPAGVDYTTMFETARAEGETHRHGPRRRFLRWLTLDQLFLHPTRLRAIGTALRLYQRIGLAAAFRKLRLPYLLGRKLGELEKQTPVMSPAFSDNLIAEIEHPPSGIPVRGRVALLSGCVQSLAFADVNRATADVLLRNGWEVVTPHRQPCCGSLHAHNGAPDLAAVTALALMDQFDLDSLDAVITNAGGCGSHLKRYRHLLPDDPRAAAWDAKVKDIHEFLVATGYHKPDATSLSPRQVTYHESCHLCHGQGISSAPREILRAIPGLDLIELPESSACCGSAGIYNLLQPEESRRQLDRKLAHIRHTGAPLVATSNPGCHLQLARGLAGAAAVTQPVMLLAEAYRRS